MPIVDARGLTAMPGFIDAHRHIIGGNSDQWFKEQAARMQEFLEAGYTTLMSGGGPVPGIVQLKERIEKGRSRGRGSSRRAAPIRTTSRPPEEARRQVQMLEKAGVEIIKARIEPPAAEQTGHARRRRGRSEEAEPRCDGARGQPERWSRRSRPARPSWFTRRTNGYVTAEQAKFIKDSGIEMLSTIGFGVPVFGVFNKDNKPTFRDGKPWPARDARGAAARARGGREGRQRPDAVGCGCRPTGSAPTPATIPKAGARARVARAQPDVLAPGHRQADGTEYGGLHREERRPWHARAGQARRHRPASTATRSRATGTCSTPKVVIKGGEVVVDKRFF